MSDVFHLGLKKADLQGATLAIVPGDPERVKRIAELLDNPVHLASHREFTTWRGEMGLFVQDVYVAPAGRGQGLGRQLLAAAMAAADWQPQFLTLMVAHVNQNARDFYAALGLTLRDEADQLILEGEGLTALMTA